MITTKDMRLLPVVVLAFAQPLPAVGADAPTIQQKAFGVGAITLGGVIGQRIDLTLNRNLHQIDLGKEFLDYYRIPDLSLAVDDELFRPDPGYTLQSLREDWEKPPAKKAEKG